MQNLTSYQKGVGVAMIEADLIQVSELMVEHPGQEMTAAGLVYGWYYRKSESGLWSRVAHPDECPCNDASTHNRHLSALKIAEDFLRSSPFVEGTDTP